MSTAAMLGRLVVAMAVVVAVMWLAARVLRSRTGAPAAGSRRSGPGIDVVARRGLTRNASVALVRTGGRTLLVGVTDASVTLISEIDPDEVGTDPGPSGTELTGGPAPAGATQKTLVDTLRELTVRRA